MPTQIIQEGIERHPKSPEGGHEHTDEWRLTPYSGEHHHHRPVGPKVERGRFSVYSGQVVASAVLERDYNAPVTGGYATHHEA